VTADEIPDVRRLDDASDALEELWRVLDAEEPIEVALQGLVEVVLKVVVDADAVSITVNPDDGPRTAAASHEWAITIDKNQYAVDDGPCLEAARIRQMVMVTGRDAFSRWPHFAIDSAQYGVQAYLSAPLLLAGPAEELVGALNVYGLRPDAFDRLDEALLRLVVTAVSATIVTSRGYLRMRAIADSLRTAMASRSEIEQAKGVLMAVHSVTADDAFEMLVVKSQNTNTKLATVARQLLASLRKQQA
jgi:transcriptional regulator with GAF, ATPase, and Fis domain